MSCFVLEVLGVLKLLFLLLFKACFVVDNHTHGRPYLQIIRYSLEYSPSGDVRYWVNINKPQSPLQVVVDGCATKTQLL